MKALTDRTLGALMFLACAAGCGEPVAEPMHPQEKSAPAIEGQRPADRDADRPGTGQPGTGQPGTGQPGTGQPGTGRPGTGRPTEDHPATAGPGQTAPEKTAGQAPAPKADGPAAGAPESSRTDGSVTGETETPATGGQGKSGDGKTGDGKTGDGSKGNADQDKPASDPAAQERLKQQLLATVQKEGIELDRKAKTVTFPVVVNAPANELEYLLIHPQGKSHEALLVSKCKPSILNSALILLGLEPGRNARFVPRKPEPTPEQEKAGVDRMVLVPPTGTAVYMTVSYEKDGNKITRAVEELIHDWEANTSVTGNQWIYLGGRMDQLIRNDPKVYMADFEGNLISTCYLVPPNHLFTISHERARDDMNWSPTASCPEPGTEMKLTIHLQKPQVVKDYEERMRKELAARKAAGKTGEEEERKERHPANREQTPPPKYLPPADKGKGDDKSGKTQTGEKKQG